MATLGVGTGTMQKIEAESVASAVRASGSCRQGAQAQERLQTVEDAHDRGLGREWLGLTDVDSKVAA
jgi:hypothetical protein